MCSMWGANKLNDEQTREKGKIKLFVCFFFLKKQLVCCRPHYYARFARQEPVNQNWYNLLDNESGRR